MKKWALVGLLLMVSGSVAMGSLTINLVAVGGTGYTVENGGKTVKLSAGVTTVNFNVTGTFSAPSDDDVIFTISGNVVSNKDMVKGGAITEGSTAITVGSAFRTGLWYPGKSQEMSGSTGMNGADGLKDVGRAGSASTSTGGVPIWTYSSGSNSDFIAFKQNALSPTVFNNQTLGTMTLTITSLSVTPGAKTQMQWYFRSTSSNQSFQEDGVAVTPSFAASPNLMSGAPVDITVVPEPVSLVLLGLGGLGMLRRKNGFASRQ